MSELIRRVRSVVAHPQVFEDERGFVFEMLRLAGATAGAGQVYVTAANPGQSKGHHYHTRKTEWFCVVSGTGEIVLEDMATGATDRVIMEAGRPVVVEVPPGIVHALRNTGHERFVSVVYVNEAFNPDDSDTFPRRLF